MSTTGTTPWNVLSGAIHNKVQQAKQRAQAMKDQEQQTEYKAWDSVLTNPNSTEQEREQALTNLKKLVPKDTVPLIEGYHKVVDLVHRKRQQKQAQGQAQAQPGTGTQSGQSGSQPGSSGAPSTMPNAAPTGPNAGQMSLPQALSGVNDPARQISADMQSQVAQAKAQITGMMQGLEDAGFSKDEAKEVMRRRIEGAAGRPRENKVIVRGKDGKAHPGTYNLDTGKTTVNGEEIENPEIMWAGQAKPRQGWGRDKDGFLSFLVDPSTNQPIPGTEDRSQLPPSRIMDSIQMGHYYYTDDAGGVHDIPKVSKTVRAQGTDTSKVSGPGETGSKGTGTPTVPRNLRGPSGTGGTIIGSKDMGVLSPAGQKAAMTTGPVLENTDRLLQKIHDAGLDDNNQVGYLMGPNILYKLGYASDHELADDIAGLNLEGVIAAASALAGTSRSISALRLAMKHVPEPYKDSPKLMREKLTEIKRRLDAVMQDIKRYGGKRAKAEAIPPALTPPASAGAPKSGDGSSPDQAIVIP